MTIEIKQIDGHLFRGPVPRTTEDFESLRKLGIDTILNLETNLLDIRGRKRCRYTEFALKYGFNTIELPLGFLLPPSLNRLALAVRILWGTNKPIYVHCFHGVDRTGMVVASYRAKILGQDFDTVRNDMIENGFHLGRYWWWIRRLKRFCKSH